jgi:hypothetical protein
MDKRRSQLHSAHKICLKTILYETLMVVETCSAGMKTKPRGIFQHEKLEMFLQPLPQPALLYGKMGTTAGLGTSNRSKNTLTHSSNCSWKPEGGVLAGERAWTNVYQRNLGCFFLVSSSATKGPMDKRKPQLDSACQKSPKTPLRAF